MNPIIAEALSQPASETAIKLLPFQTEIINNVAALVAKGTKRILVVSVTGSGKTVLAGEMKKRLAATHLKTLFIAHRDELLVQTRDNDRHFGVVAGIIKAGREKDLRPLASAQVAGIQTLHARAFRSKSIELPPADLVFLDEAHHCRAKTYQALIDAYPNAVIIGLTATPCRGDGRGLGNVFEEMVVGPQVEELIGIGLLVKPRIFAPPQTPDLRGIKTAAGDYIINQLGERMDTDALVGDIIEHWLRHAQRRTTVIFAVTVAHSVHIVNELRKSGVRAEHLDGNTPQDEREAILARLADGTTEVVSNCGVLTEGFNLTSIGCVVLARPTKSLGLYRQMIGRGLRASPGKSECIILDHAGATCRHGRPDDPIEWTLDEDDRATNERHEKRVAKTGRESPFCECPACRAQRVRGEGCPECGWEPKLRGKDVETIDGELVELGSAALTQADKKVFYAELRGYQATARKKDGSPYAKGWAAVQFKEKYGQFPPWDWNNLPPIAPTLATQRWIKSRMIRWAKAKAAA